MFAVRRWSVRHARVLERLYDTFEGVLLGLGPLWRLISHDRLDHAFAAIERPIKGFLFDCRMCGQCTLSETGMSCPMTCPKGLRNGPCGGVRADGGCEVVPTMPCVWVEAWHGSRRMRQGDQIARVQGALDHGLRGTSSWLRVIVGATGAGGGRERGTVR